MFDFFRGGRERRFLPGLTVLTGIGWSRDGAQIVNCFLSRPVAHSCCVMKGVSAISLFTMRHVRRCAVSGENHRDRS